MSCVWLGEKRLSFAEGARALEDGAAITGERSRPSRLAGEDHELSGGGARRRTRLG